VYYIPVTVIELTVSSEKLNMISLKGLAANCEASNRRVACLKPAGASLNLE
jgi:hypothetical protein